LRSPIFFCLFDIAYGYERTYPVGLSTCFLIFLCLTLLGIYGDNGIKRFHKTQPKTKSERELRVLCTKLLQVDIKEEVEADAAIKTLAHATDKKQPDSKKQTILGNSTKHYLIQNQNVNYVSPVRRFYEVKKKP